MGFPGLQFNRHLEFRVGVRDKFKDISGGNFSTRVLEVKSCLKTQNMISDRFGDALKMSIELHPWSRRSPTHRG